MVATSIEQLKRDFTDKYVKVDASRPELARFHDLVGQVKTVNMSRRALVEFLDYHLNIAWYDIDLSCLTVVDKPLPKAPEEKKAEAKKAAEKPAAKPAAKAATAAVPAKPAAAGAKMSVAEMLAAARSGGPAAAKPATPAAPKAKAADAPPAPAAKPAAPAAKPAGGKLSVAEMLAAARAGAAPAAKAPAPAAPAEEPAADEEPVAAAPAAKPAKAAPPKAAGGRVDRSTMSVADMIAYCREHDAA